MRIHKNKTHRTPNTYSVTPAAHMSTLNPENVSKPFAISGGWKAGEPWLVLQVSSKANGPSCYRNKTWFEKDSVTETSIIFTDIRNVKNTATLRKIPGGSPCNWSEVNKEHPQLLTRMPSLGERYGLNRFLPLHKNSAPSSLFQKVAFWWPSIVKWSP